MQKLFTPSDFKERRENLLKLIKQKHQNDKGAVILFGSLELDSLKFNQESSFYYFTGVNEPGAVAVINLDGKDQLLVPQSKVRMHWVNGCIDPKVCKSSGIGFNELNYLGQELKGFEYPQFFSKEDCANLINLISNIVKDNGKVFTLYPQDSKSYFQQRFILERLIQFIPELKNAIVDISSIVAQLRRKKSKKEIEALYKAIDITILAHEAAIEQVDAGKSEAEVQAAIEYMFTASNCQTAFASIVGSGINSTVLHYTANNKILKTGELVVVDIGAQFEHYAGDLTRTYPVSGKFSKRQKEIYNIVLDAQDYIANLAKPGMWLSNAQEPEHSLNHLCREFFKKQKLDQYFLHGVGHFLGLDVHDVGDYSIPLETGDVITIEPGIYIAQENLGIRIEDNYWITSDGSICLSENLPKATDEIEQLISNKDKE